ncbi:PTS sugar transporter subunit IIB, partial [Escherichia coli]|nr:PTS sugar transporter subunit IIB [Escherichia coli]HBC2957098.1 PTS sugar transporter subunit IIB [Escherichia coli O146]EFE9165455.1 PTS sugar transporter subunit IIB [Escherichia coli]EFF1718304.1 PTS sugar transporter subunit IIB [Escherichia coli]EFF1718652.1 PTS sugar transporter subunit IIB [Escherichia coli]
MKITVVCGNGLGTSLMMEMSIKSILKDLSVSADVDHVDLGSAKGTPSDIYVGTK